MLSEKNHLLLPFLKNHKYSYNDQAEANQVVPAELFFLKKNNRKQCKNGKCYGLLYGFQLNQAKGSPIFFKSCAVGGNLKRYSKKANAQLIIITENRPRLLPHENSLNLRWPYQANVMKVFEIKRNIMVLTPRILQR